MSIKDIINKFFGGFQEYIDTEKELLKLRIVKEISGVLGIVIAAVFLIMIFHIGIALIGIWLGFLLSSVFDSYSIGFGITGSVYILWLAVLVVFRRPLLITPFTNIVISAMTEDESNEEDEDGSKTT